MCRDSCRYAMPCYAMPCYAMLCYAVLCCAMLLSYPPLLVLAPFEGRLGDAGRAPHARLSVLQPHLHGRGWVYEDKMIRSASAAPGVWGKVVRAPRLQRCEATSRQAGCARGARSVRVRLGPNVLSGGHLPNMGVRPPRATQS